MKTLIIVDVQNDFMPQGTLAVPKAHRIVPVINSLLRYFDSVVATQDWHPEHHQSFASNHLNKKPFETIMLEGIEQTLWPVHCVQGTRGAEFHPDLDTRSIDAIIRKGMKAERDSYSGFYDTGRQSTGLTGYLREKGAETLYFCGLCADICVYHTLKDALDAGFNCYLIEDATCALDITQFQKIKTELLNRGCGILNSIDLAREI